MFICSLCLLLNILLPLLCSLTWKTNLGHRGPHGFQNCAPELHGRVDDLFIYIFFNFFLLCHLMGRKNDARGASLGLQTLVRDLFSSSKAGGLVVLNWSWEEDPKRENLLGFHFCFPSFQMCQTTIIISEMFSVKCQSLSHLCAGKGRECSYPFGTAIASVTQSACATAEPAVLKGQHPTWMLGKKEWNQMGSARSWWAGFHLLNLGSSKVQQKWAWWSLTTQRR